MASATHNFFIEQGGTFEIIFEYLDESNNPIAISNNDCVRLRLKDNLNNYRAWKDATLDNGSLLTKKQDPSLASNQIKWILPATATREFIFDIASYALDIVVNSDETRAIKLATGQISIIKDIFSTECFDGTLNANFKTCKDCVEISSTDSEGTPVSVTPTPSQTLGATPTPSLSFGTTPTPTPSFGGGFSAQEDLCDVLCRGLDIFAELYTGSSLSINDASISGGISTPSVTSGTVSVNNPGIATNIELYIDKLNHTNPSDLSMLLQPPSGDPVFLSYRTKINNHNLTSGTSFAFSNKALPGIYLNNKSNSNDLYVNILQDSAYALPAPYDSLTYEYSFDHLISAGSGSVSGDWNLYFIDHDAGVSGSINGWNLIITYEPPVYEEE